MSASGGDPAGRATPDPVAGAEVAGAEVADDEAFVVLGEVTGVFGFRGELRLFLHNPRSNLLDRPFRVTLEQGGKRREALLQARSGAGKRILGRVDGLDDEAGARALVGAAILARKADLPDPGEGELYVHELVGGGVFVAGERVGTLRDVLPSGPTFLLEIDAGRRDPVFVPAIEAFVERLAPGEVHLRPGALDE